MEGEPVIKTVSYAGIARIRFDGLVSDTSQPQNGTPTVGANISGVEPIINSQKPCFAGSVWTYWPIQTQKRPPV